MPPRRSFGDDDGRGKETFLVENASAVRARLAVVPSLDDDEDDDDVSVVVSLTLAVVEEEQTKTREQSQSRVSNHSFEEIEPNEKNDANEEERKMFLSTQDEKIGHLEDPIAFTEEDFLRPKFAHHHHHRGHGRGGQTLHERTQSSLNNATTCSILSLEDSALDATLGAEEAEALAARGRMYERNTDLMGEEEEVDPRVETALEDLNDAAEEVNKAEQEYDRGKRTLREEKERAREAVDGMYKQLGGAVKKAVPALHKRAVASLYQNRSQEAMIAHAECFDHHEKCKKTVSKLERMLAKTREETKEEDDDASPSSSSSSSPSSSSFSKDEDEEEDNEEETEELIDEDHSDDNHNPELATTSPSASPKKKKKRKKKKRMDKSNLRLLEKLSEAVASVTEAERVMRRALLAHETNAKLAMEAVDECARLSSNTKNIRAIKKAQRYFAIKKEGEDAIEKLESSVKEMRAKLKTCKSRYGECLEQLNAISKEIHERRELEKKTKALKLMKSSAK
ncbi:unnamed protein product [Bathycoccus prasinos]|jgi:hypothetical protein|tara:strand:+ start:1505 stop:3034 length:1530 start_codon:yes stop_codon:yes gene_type:complete